MRENRNCWEDFYSSIVHFKLLNSCFGLISQEGLLEPQQYQSPLNWGSGPKAVFSVIFWCGHQHVTGQWGTGDVVGLFSVCGKWDFLIGMWIENDCQFVKATDSIHFLVILMKKFHWWDISGLNCLTSLLLIRVGCLGLLAGTQYIAFE